MNNVKKDNGNQRTDDMSQEKDHKGNGNLRPNTNGKNKINHIGDGDGEEKNRKDQVLAKLNDNPTNDDDEAGESERITNKDTKITNGSRKNDRQSMNNDATDKRNTIKDDEKAESKRKEALV